jgi:hypothetical protein
LNGTAGFVTALRPFDFSVRPGLPLLGDPVWMLVKGYPCAEGRLA